nr:syntaxin-binding protein 4 [Salvelinus alpinus]
MERLRKDHIEALREIKKLQEQLAESERLHLQMQEELNRVKQEVKSGTDESRALRSRIHLAVAAQKQARGMEMDYEEVIHLLEAEIAELKAQRNEQQQPGQAKCVEPTQTLLDLAPGCFLSSLCESVPGSSLSPVLRKVCS